jgi:hypothetical protein
MMHPHYGRTRILALLLGLTAFAWAVWASADPPTRVARLGYLSGAVSFSPAGENDWVLATMNRPLISGDRLWLDDGARSELQIGSAVIRMSGSTSVTLLNLEDRVTQVQLAQGTLNVRVRRLGPQEVFEIATPNLAYSIRRAGAVRQGRESRAARRDAAPAASCCPWSTAGVAGNEGTATARSTEGPLAASRREERTNGTGRTRGSSTTGGPQGTSTTRECAETAGGAEGATGA